MPIIRFPDPKDIRQASPEGIVAVGGDLHLDSLLLAYKQGIFPWPIEGLPLPWFCPDPRAILDFKDLHIPRSLARDRKKATVRYTVDQAFAKVIQECAKAKRPGQKGTWITPQMARAYVKLHEEGHAHSVEVWKDQELVGGIYGVEVGGVFSGESMFHRKPNASKFALLHLVEILRSGGCTWMDIQVMTPHMEALGAKEISRDAFLRKLARTHAEGLRPFAGAKQEGSSP